MKPILSGTCPSDASASATSASTDHGLVALHDVSLPRLGSSLCRAGGHERAAIDAVQGGCMGLAPSRRLKQSPSMAAAAAGGAAARPSPYVPQMESVDWNSRWNVGKSGMRAARRV